MRQNYTHKSKKSRKRYKKRRTRKTKKMKGAMDAASTASFRSVEDVPAGGADEGEPRQLDLDRLAAARLTVRQDGMLEDNYDRAGGGVSLQTLWNRVRGEQDGPTEAQTRGWHRVAAAHVQVGKLIADRSFITELLNKLLLVATGYDEKYRAFTVAEPGREKLSLNDKKEVLSFIEEFTNLNLIEKLIEKIEEIEPGIIEMTKGNWPFTFPKRGSGKDSADPNPGPRTLGFPAHHVLKYIQKLKGLLGGRVTEVAGVGASGGEGR